MILTDSFKGTNDMIYFSLFTTSAILDHAVMHKKASSWKAQLQIPSEPVFFQASFLKFL